MIKETFEIHSDIDTNWVCKLDPMIFGLIVFFLVIILYVMLVKSK
jgi:hypothetical protein